MDGAPGELRERARLLRTGVHATGAHGTRLVFCGQLICTAAAGHGVRQGIYDQRDTTSWEGLCEAVGLTRAVAEASRESPVASRKSHTDGWLIGPRPAGAGIVDARRVRSGVRAFPGPDTRTRGTQPVL